MKSFAVLLAWGGMQAPADVARFADRAADAFVAANADLLKVCRAGDLSEVYFASYDLDGLLAAAEATGREDFLQPALECIEALIAAGQDKDGDGAIDFYHSADKAWDSSARGISSSTLLKGLRPIPRAARVILQRFARKPWLARAQSLIAFTEKHVIEKWRKLGHLDTARSGTIHIQGNMGEILVDTYLATGKEEYRRHAETFAKAAKDNMVLVEGGYVWKLCRQAPSGRAVRIAIRGARARGDSRVGTTRAQGGGKGG